MRVVIGCDFDPVLPVVLERRPADDVWEPTFRGLERLLSRVGDGLPPITWLLRSDESVRFATGDYDSAWRRAPERWERLLARGHEIGWHMHLASHDAGLGRFRFDPEPDWLPAAKSALDDRLPAPTRSTRTGWDYGSNFLMRRLDELGVAVDFSALPGNIVWPDFAGDRITVDWRRTARRAYHPDRGDYQRPGGRPLGLLEVPVSQFVNPLPAMAKRAVWRAVNGCLSLRGIRAKTLLLHADWGGRLPDTVDDVAVAFFHPEDLLDDDALERAARNIDALGTLPGAEFVTAGALADRGSR